MSSVQKSAGILSESYACCREDTPVAFRMCSIFDFLRSTMSSSLVLLCLISSMALLHLTSDFPSRRATDLVWLMTQSHVLQRVPGLANDAALFDKEG
ncbi:hypothetical protein BJX96DRAFT_18684 [Aspergillus floccosus]